MARGRGGLAGRAPRRGPDHPRHPPGRGGGGDRGRRPLRSTSCSPWTRSTARRRCSPRWPSSSRPTRPSASTPGWRASARTGRTSTPTSTSWPTACARAARPPGSSRTARSSSCARTQAIPIGEAIVPAMSRVANDADRERVRDVVREVVYPADRRLLDALDRAVPRGDARAARPRVRARRRHALPARDPPLDLARHGARATSTRWASTSWRRSTRSGGRSPAPRASATDIAAYRRKLTIDTTNQAPSPEALVARCNEDIVRAAEVAPTMFGRLPVATCEVRPVEAFKERDAPFAYYFPPSLDLLAARHLLRQHLRPAEPDVLEARVDHLPRGDPGASLPDQPRDGAGRPQRVPPARRPRRRAARTSRAGDCTRSASRTSSGCTGRPPSGSGCSTPRHGARRG